MRARDEFLACLDKGLDAGKTEDQATKACRSQLRAFEDSCPASWITHFIRQHNFQRYKETLAEQGVNIADENALGDEKHQQ
ncbi:hypothetical protein OESDEN_19039 [Oesophagostomum dentatum]|uniref:Cytochrome oxidase c subunit VIb n=1 Tax=Oesophagostomum dentatum TaxID=61180 RepID=A0A0B1SDJ1_OESDE|nr:hypothetical protein OESDEN_19039 [Oesophagostomum dentatum]